MPEAPIMPHLVQWPMVCRVTFLRELWQRIGDQAGGRPIAIYGAGRHTQSLLETVRAHGQAETVRVAFILDDNPGARKEIYGVPVRSPQDASPNEVAIVLVSTDTVEAALADRARIWAVNGARRGTSITGTIPRVAGIYGEDNAELLNAHIKKSRGVWGTTLTERNGHLPMQPDEIVLRLERAPERTARSPLPLPPPELRAGYHTGNDEKYLESGRRAVANIRGMIERHAPSAVPLKRVLDWGCSSGRMLRHWEDVASEGGEVWGCDICATAMNWAAENLAPPLRFFQCTTRPHLPLPDASMDLVYGNSVFTHIRELVDTWLMELRRVVRPGGLVFVSILDEECWERCRKEPDNVIRRRCGTLDFSEPMRDDCVCYGGSFDPVTFWHTRGIRRRWSFAFDVLAIEHGIVPVQAGVLMRRP